MTRRQILTYSIALLVMLVGTNEATAHHIIPSDTSIGTWDESSRIFELTMNVGQTIVISEDDLILDGQGWTVGIGANEFGISLTGRTGVTVQNVNIDSGYGIILKNCQNCTLRSNTSSNNITGFRIFNGIGCVLENNTANSNSLYGVILRWCSDCTLTDNIAVSNNNSSIRLQECDNCTLTNNTASSGNGIGIWLWGSSGHTMTGNTMSDSSFGIRFEPYSSTDSTIYSNNNTLTGNTISYNFCGIQLLSSSNNQIYNNNFIDNTKHASVEGDSSANVFNLSATEGCGNHWSGWTSPDEDENGIVDVAYGFTGAQDDLQWVAQGGWLDPGWSQPGTDVTVQPVDETTGEILATLSFDNITQGGMTTLTSMTPSENQGPPQGFKFGAPPVIIDITTTAVFTGEVEICFDYSWMSFGNESTLKLFHSSDGSNWIDITTSVDTANDVICGTVTSFSFFGVFETADPVALLQELAQQVTVLNLQKGIDNSLDSKLDAALQALDDVNEHNDVAALNSLQAFINAVEAQRGNKISEADADVLIAAAQQIIDFLTNG